MLVIVAQNQVLTAPIGTTVSTTTDPIRIGSNNQVTAITLVHEIFGANPPFSGLHWRSEISMDGEAWVTQGPAEGAITATGTYLAPPTTLTGVWYRLVIEYECDAGAVGAATFDIHLNFDRS
jgi:hypothetical protein